MAKRSGKSSQSTSPTLESVLGDFGADDRCDECDVGTMREIVITKQVSLKGAPVGVPGVLANRCDHCGAIEYSGREEERARRIATLMLAKQVA